MGGNWPAPPAEWIATVEATKEQNIAKMAPKLMKNSAPMDFHSALGALRTVIRERPDTILVNEGANTLDLARGIIDIYRPRRRLDVGTWGVMGIGMGFAVAAAVETGKNVLAVVGDSAFGFSGMEVETICREREIDPARVFVAIQDLSERPPAIDGSEDAALFVRAVQVSEYGDK